MEISDPDHERYGRYLSKDQVDDLVRPYDESLDLVTEWLEKWGIYEEDISRSAAKDWVTVMIPVRLAEQMLNAVRDALLVQEAPFH
jgi:tripeptidyl-peptidase-1